MRFPVLSNKLKSCKKESESIIAGNPGSSHFFAFPFKSRNIDLYIRFFKLSLLSIFPRTIPSASRLNAEGNGTESSVKTALLLSFPIILLHSVFAFFLLRLFSFKQQDQYYRQFGNRTKSENRYNHIQIRFGFSLPFYRFFILFYRVIFLFNLIFHIF